MVASGHNCRQLPIVNEIKMIKHRQHYVWQNYIKAWCNTDGLVHFSRNNEMPHLTTPKNVMVERHFYELQPLTEADIEFLKIYIQHTGYQDLRSHHEELMWMFAFIANIYEFLENQREVLPSDIEIFRKLAIETEENLHNHIENNAVPILDQLRQKQTSFLGSHESAATFFFYFAQQYCRTKTMRESFKSYFSRQRHFNTSANVANIVSYISACNIGYTLFALSETFDIIFLENEEPGIVTGDQPVINLLGNRFGGDTTGTAFYYPLSPHLACLLTSKSYSLSSKQITERITNKLNGLISWNAHHILIGDSKETIQLAIKNQPVPNQSVRDVFDFLTKTS